MIRPMTLDDLPLLPALHAEGETRPERLRRAEVALVRLFRRLYFDNPWRDSRVSSLVSEDGDGRINGMIGVVGRPFRFRGRPVTVAVCSELYVERESRPRMVGVQLLRAFLRGPQDVSLADIANDASRAIWERLGGTTAPLYDLNWLYPLQPAQFLLEAASTTPVRRAVACVARPVAKMVDGVVGVRKVVAASRGRTAPSAGRPGGGRGGAVELCCEPLTAELFAEHFSRLTSRHPLRPDYDARAARWLWKRLDFLWRDAGPSRSVALRDARGRLVGWYVYQARRGGVARVAQVVAQSHWTGPVLDHLFEDARRRGAVAVLGRLQPELLRDLLDRGCLFRPRRRFTLVHSRDAELLDAFRRGEAFLSLLEGEAVLDVWNQPERALAELLKEEPEGVVGARQSRPTVQPKGQPEGPAEEACSGQPETPPSVPLTP